MEVSPDAVVLVEIQIMFILYISIIYRLGSEIGSGQFGRVSHGVWHHDEETEQVAIKTLHGEVSEEAKKTLLKEAAIIGQFAHANIVKLYGVVTSGDPVSLDAPYANTSVYTLYNVLYITGNDII